MSTSTTRVLIGLFTLCLFAGTPHVASAQTWTNQLALTGGLQSPTGPFSDEYQPGVGFDGTYYYRASRSFFLGVSGGYHWFQAEGTDTVLDAIPLQLAFKANLSLTGLQPYIGADGGPVLLRTEASNIDTNHFGVAPKFGVRLPIVRGADLDLNLTYEVIFTDPETTTYIGANAGVAYIFGR